VEIGRLLAGGVESKDIISLDTTARNSAIAGCAKVASLPVQNLAEDIGNRGALHFATMHSFKGLERKVVLAIDLENIGKTK